MCHGGALRGHALLFTRCIHAGPYAAATIAPRSSVKNAAAVVHNVTLFTAPPAAAPPPPPRPLYRSTEPPPQDVPLLAGLAGVASPTSPHVSFDVPGGDIYSPNGTSFAAFAPSRRGGGHEDDDDVAIITPAAMELLHATHPSAAALGGPGGPAGGSASSTTSSFAPGMLTLAGGLSAASGLSATGGSFYAQNHLYQQQQQQQQQQGGSGGAGGRPGQLQVGQLATLMDVFAAEESPGPLIKPRKLQVTWMLGSGGGGQPSQCAVRSGSPFGSPHGKWPPHQPLPTPTHVTLQVHEQLGVGRHGSLSTLDRSFTHASSKAVPPPPPARASATTTPASSRPTTAHAPAPPGPRSGGSSRDASPTPPSRSRATSAAGAPQQPAPPASAPTERSPSPAVRRSAGGAAAQAASAASAGGGGAPLRTVPSTGGERGTAPTSLQPPPSAQAPASASQAGPPAPQQSGASPDPTATPPAPGAGGSPARLPPRPRTGGASSRPPSMLDHASATTPPRPSQAGAASSAAAAPADSRSLATPPRSRSPNPGGDVPAPGAREPLPFSSPSPPPHPPPGPQQQHHHQHTSRSASPLRQSLPAPPASLGAGIAAVLSTALPLAAPSAAHTVGALPPLQHRGSGGGAALGPARDDAPGPTPPRASLGGAPPLLGSDVAALGGRASRGPSGSGVRASLPSLPAQQYEDSSSFGALGDVAALQQQQRNRSPSPFHRDSRGQLKAPLDASPGPAPRHAAPPLATPTANAVYGPPPLVPLPPPLGLRRSVDGVAPAHLAAGSGPRQPGDGGASSSPSLLPPRASQGGRPPMPQRAGGLAASVDSALLPAAAAAAAMGEGAGGSRYASPGPVMAPPRGGASACLVRAGGGSTANSRHASPAPAARASHHPSRDSSPAARCGMASLSADPPPLPAPLEGGGALRREGSYARLILQQMRQSQGGASDGGPDAAKGRDSVCGAGGDGLEGGGLHGEEEDGSREDRGALPTVVPFVPVEALGQLRSSAATWAPRLTAAQAAALATADREAWVQSAAGGAVASFTHTVTAAGGAGGKAGGASRHTSRDPSPAGGRVGGGEHLVPAVPMRRALERELREAAHEIHDGPAWKPGGLGQGEGGGRARGPGAGDEAGGPARFFRNQVLQHPAQLPALQQATLYMNRGAGFEVVKGGDAGLPGAP